MRTGRSTSILAAVRCHFGCHPTQSWRFRCLGSLENRLICSDF
jgi:hypothetical protein